MSPYFYIDNNELMRECRKGDREALSLFYSRFAPRMLGVVRMFVSNPRDAEDILHDGFIVALTRLDTLRNKDNIETWLAGIMRNLALQYLKSQDVAVLLQDVSEVPEAPEFDKFIDIDTLESLMCQLPAGYQKVFKLAVLENKSHKEISRILGISTGTSTSQLFHAKVMMRRLIADYRLRHGLAILILGGASLALLLRTVGYRHGMPFTLQADDLISLYAPNAAVPEAEAHDATSTATNMPAQHPTTVVHTYISAATPPSTITSINTPASSPTLCDTVGEPPAMQVYLPEDDLSASTTIAEADTVSLSELLNDAFAFYDDSDETSAGTGKLPTLAVSVNAGIVQSGLKTSGDFITRPNNPSYEGNDETGTDNSDKDKETKNIRRAQEASQFIPYEEASSHHSLPVVVNITANKMITGALGIETGLSYTYLHSTFENKSCKSTCEWHYLGIPVRINLNTFTTGRLRLYASAGAQVNIPLHSTATVTALSTSIAPNLKPGSFKSSVVWSVSASYGAAIRLNRNTEIFIEPTADYHFKHSYEVPDTWNDSPWGFSLPIGFRFNW